MTLSIAIDLTPAVTYLIWYLLSPKFTERPALATAAQRNILDAQPVFSAMPFKDPLTTEQLRAIRERQPWNPDVIALLWEIKRLRIWPLRFNQMVSELKRPIGITGVVYDEAVEELPKEPCVQDQMQMTAELLEEPRKLRKGMAPR